MVLAVSTTGPIIAATDAPALAIAFWRCVLGGGVLWLVVLLARRTEVRRLTRTQWGAIAVSGIFLGAHFAVWVPSLRFTSVASSTALVATQPVWAALIARLRGTRVPRQAWAGIAVSLVGVVWLTGVDVSLDSRHLFGDVLALLGAIFAAIYVTAGERARASVSTVTTSAATYTFAAVVLLGCTLAFGQALAGYSQQAWLLIIALTVVGQLLGHTLASAVLATTSATIVSLAILFEMPGATVIAALVLGQFPPLALYPAVALIFAGLFIVIRSISSRTVTELAAP